MKWPWSTSKSLRKICLLTLKPVEQTLYSAAVPIKKKKWPWSTNKSLRMICLLTLKMRESEECCFQCLVTSFWVSLSLILDTRFECLRSSWVFVINEKSHWLQILMNSHWLQILNQWEISLVTNTQFVFVINEISHWSMRFQIREISLITNTRNLIDQWEISLITNTHLIDFENQWDTRSNGVTRTNTHELLRHSNRVSLGKSVSWWRDAQNPM